MNTLVETQYFPTQAFFGFLLAGPLIIEQHEHYQKRSFRNKCMIQHAGSIQMLSVPLVKGKHQGQNITEVQISYDQPWFRHHLQAIRSAYGKAPYFGHYFPVIEELILKEEKYLFRLNALIIEVVKQQLQLEQPILYTSSFQAHEIDERDMRGIITPKNYHQVKAYQTYPQVFSERHDFIPNLSILDLLFCCGPETRAILAKLSL